MSLRPLVVYYRVSSDQQKRSGLGLMAQHDAVRRYLEATPGTVVAELTEIESGRQSTRNQRSALALPCLRRETHRCAARSPGAQHRDDRRSDGQRS